MAKARPVPGLRPRATLLENARAIIAVRAGEMFGFADAIGDPARDEDLHNMRIAAKRLRYTLEMFRVCLGPDGPALIDTVKEIQERIGLIHDADVLVEVARVRLAVAAQRQVEALVAATGAGDERQRVERVRAALAASDDPRLGLALLMARTRAEREQNSAALVAWWAEHGGGVLRARLDACLCAARPVLSDGA
jgi:hypothetical protein